MRQGRHSPGGHTSDAVESSSHRQSAIFSSCVKMPITNSQSSWRHRVQARSTNRTVSSRATSSGVATSNVMGQIRSAYNVAAHLRTERSLLSS